MTNDRLQELIAEYAEMRPRRGLRNLLYPAASAEEIRELIDGYRRAPRVCLWTRAEGLSRTYRTACGHSNYEDMLPPYCKQCGGEVQDPDVEFRNQTSDIAVPTCAWARNFSTNTYHTQCGRDVTASFAELWYADKTHRPDRCLFCGAMTRVDR